MIRGVQPPEKLTDVSIPPEAFLTDLEKYIKEKAYEPKSKWLTTTIYPGALGVGLAKLTLDVAHKLNKTAPPETLISPKKFWPIVAGVGAGISMLGAGLKLADDAKVNTARTLVKSPDFKQSLLNYIEIRRSKNGEYKDEYKFMSNPTLKNLKILVRSAERSSKATE